MTQQDEALKRVEAQKKAKYAKIHAYVTRSENGEECIDMEEMDSEDLAEDLRFIHGLFAEQNRAYLDIKAKYDALCVQYDAAQLALRMG
jgi:hypothetical protein